MRRFAKWHIWLGWLVGVPFLLWTVSGFVMVVKPIEEVRGNHLRIEAKPAPLSGDPPPVLAPGDPSPQRPVELHTAMQGAQMVTRATYADGRIERYLADGRRMAPLTEQDARRVVQRGIVGGDKVASVEFFDADNAPMDFRRPEAAWRLALADGAHVYVGRDSGEIAAVRTRFWRFYDFMWGLHIMDLQTREDTHNPFIIAFAVLALLGALLGTVLLFRRRKARVTA